MAGVLTELWTGEMVKKLSHADQATFLNGIPDYSNLVNNDVIHLEDVGVEPDVLINNKTYPIETQDLGDGDIAISLDKYQTKVTAVTDDELFACSYNKIQSVIDRHGNALAEKKHDKAIHALAPSSDSAKTPIIITDGELTSEMRYRVTRANIIALKKKFDEMSVPVQGRRLVLCADHVEDLLLNDQKFADQYYNYASGKISNLYGFEVYEYVANPVYTTAGVKKQFGAATVAGEFQASVAFYAPGMFRCEGQTSQYYSLAKTDPKNQQNLINFRTYAIVMPKRMEAIGAIISGYKAA
jgi:hypothetical protein